MGNCYSLSPITFESIRERMQNSIDIKDISANKWIERFITHQFDKVNSEDEIELRDNIITFVKVLLIRHNVEEERIKNSLMERMMTMEEEIKKQKQKVLREKDKYAALENQYNELLKSRDMYNLELIKYKNEAAAAIDNLNLFEKKCMNLNETNSRLVLLAKIITGILISYIIISLDIYLLFTNNDWSVIPKLQKTFILSSIPVLVSILTMIFYGAQKGGKVFSLVSAVVGIIAGIYKCF